MKRREFIAGLGSAAAWPLAALAQRGERVRHIGVLMTIASSDPEAQLRLMALHQGLQELGWVDGRNVRVDYRWAGIDAERIRVAAAELIGLAPDVMLAHTPAAVKILREENPTISIVFVQVADPVAAGLAASLAHPGGNITGFTNFEYAMGEKWLQLLKEIAPGANRVGVMANPQNPIWPLFMHAIEAVASALDVRVIKMAAQDATEIESAIDALGRVPNSGLIVLPDILALAQRERIIALAARHRVPAIYPYRFNVTAGGLLSYGVDNLDQWRRAASYIDRILKGAKAADLPVQQPTKFELAINLKTAKALGLTIPETLLATADEVIQ